MADKKKTQDQRFREGAYSTPQGRQVSILFIISCPLGLRFCAEGALRSSRLILAQVLISIP